MSSPTYIGIALAVFVVAALLYFQSVESFADVPADLNRAPVSRPVERMPPSKGTGPGAPKVPMQAPATRSELAELDSKLTTWIDAASQRELENPAALTMSQREKRVKFQARISAIRQQLGTGVITDYSKDVSAETLKMRNENAGWQHVYPSIGAISEFGKGSSGLAMLTNEQYAEFRGIMLANIKQMMEYPNAQPLELVRYKQLQQIDVELREIDAQNRIPLIRVGVAQKFLKSMTQSSQPLPSLMSITGVYDKALMTDPIDIIRQVQIIPNPPKGLMDLVTYMASGNASGPDVIAARRTVVDYQNQGLKQGPGPVKGALKYDPNNYIGRATKLCKEIKEAFPDDAEALGCANVANTKEAAETQVYTVCQRIRNSVPTVTPEQFNCPKVF